MRHRGPRPADILYVTHRVPYPPDKGDRIRNFHLLRFLSQRTRVHLACLADEPVSVETLRVLQAHTSSLAVIPVQPRLRWMRAAASFARGASISEGAFRSPELERVIEGWTRDTRFGAVLLSASSLARCLDLPAIRELPAVVDLVDVDSEKFRGYAERRRGPRGWVYAREARRLRRLEAELSRRCAAVTLVSEAEADLCRRFSAPHKVLAVTNGVDPEYFQPQGCATETSCVFVGAFDYAPNIEAAVWFSREVWPAVLQARPEARFQLVGRRPVSQVRELGRQPGIEVVGQVPDVRPYVARAGVVVAPLQLARGVQNKILEALAMEKAVIASTAAHEGLAARPGTHLHVAATPADWHRSLLALWGDPALRSRLGAAGRDYVSTHHCWERCLAPFAQLLGLETPSSRAAVSAPASDSMTEPAHTFVA